MQDDVLVRPGSPSLEVPFPRKVGVAGIIWSLFGGLLLYKVTEWLVPHLMDPREVDQWGLVRMVLPSVLFGLFIVYLGVSVVLGWARDTKGRAVTSMILGIIVGGHGALTLLIMGVNAGGLGLGAVGFLIGGCLGSGSLLTAGVLALVGRDQYLEWRLARRMRN